MIVALSDGSFTIDFRDMSGHNRQIKVSNPSTIGELSSRISTIFREYEIEQRKNFNNAREIENMCDKKNQEKINQLVEKFK